MDIGHWSNVILSSICYFLMISMNGAEVDLQVSEDLEICEKGKPADIVFILDASNSIWNPDFKRQLEFVQAVVDYFPIGDQNIQVGIATFSDDVFPQFPLNQFNSKRALKAGISQIYQDQGSYTRTNKAIQFMRDEFFLKSNGAREKVFRVGIVITDGRSYDTSLTVKQAQLAKEQGFHLFAIGVGNRVDMEELRGISSEPSHHYTFQVDSYRGLEQIIDLLSIKVCTVTDPPTTTATTTALPTTTTTPVATMPELKFETPPAQLFEHTSTQNPYEALRKGPDAYGVFTGGDLENSSGGPDYNSGNGGDNKGMGSSGRKFFEIDGCIPNHPMDVTFVIDSKQGGSGYTKKIWKFIKNTVSNIDLQNGDIKVRFVHDCLEVPSLHLNQHRGQKPGLLSALESMRAPTRSTADLVRLMTNQLTDPENNPNTIHQRKKVGVLVTDGQSGDLEATLREAQNAKLDNNIELYGVGITEEINDVEMKAFVSCPPEKHLLFVPNHRKLRGLHKSLARKLCMNSRS